MAEKHGTAKRCAWRKLHIGIVADSGEIVAFDLSDKDVDGASHVSTPFGSTDAGSRFATAETDRYSLQEVTEPEGPSQSSRSLIANCISIAMCRTPRRDPAEARPSRRGDSARASKHSVKEFPVGGSGDYNDHSQVYRYRPDAACEHRIGISK
jgi:hypothetical protein